VLIVTSVECVRAASAVGVDPRALAGAELRGAAHRVLTGIVRRLSRPDRCRCRCRRGAAYWCPSCPRFRRRARSAVGIDRPTGTRTYVRVDVHRLLPLLEFLRAQPLGSMIGPSPARTCVLASIVPRFGLRALSRRGRSPNPGRRERSWWCSSFLAVVCVPLSRRGRWPDPGRRGTACGCSSCSPPVVQPSGSMHDPVPAWIWVLVRIFILRGHPLPSTLAPAPARSCVLVLIVVSSW
jgi:hypothetical protein